MQVYSISEINGYLHNKFLSDSKLQDLVLSGEISNFKCHSSGHCYLTLKDDKAAIRAVIFRRAAQQLRFAPQNGMKVIAQGSVGVYERDGSYQLYIEKLMPKGMGELTVRYEQLKEKLRNEGIFAPEHKRKLPLRPHCIGIVTSETGAVLHDIFRVASLRDSGVKLLLCPAQVQGESAAEQIVAAIEKLNALELCDVLIVGRGGGSMEDLWCFNEKKTVRAIYNSKVPVVTAIGHETDFTLSDFAADRRAATPSQAAEFCVPQRGALLEGIEAKQKIMSIAVTKRLNLAKIRLNNLNVRFGNSLLTCLQQKKRSLDNVTSILHHTAKSSLSERELHLVRFLERYEGLNPERILKRGYALLSNKNGTLSHIAQLKIGDTFKGRLQDGNFIARIEAVEMEGKNGKEKDI